MTTTPDAVQIFDQNLAADPAPDAAPIVDALLAAARLTLLPHERDQYVADYPTLRAQADALYAYGDTLEPATTFDPTVFYPAPAGA